MEREASAARESRIIALIQSEQLAPVSVGPGRLRRSTLAWTSLALATCVLAWLSARDAESLLGITLVFLLGGAICVGVSVWFLAEDLIGPSPRNRNEIGKSAHCFGRLLRSGHWDKAFSCLHPAIRNYTVEVPEIPNLGVRQGSFKLSTASEFRAFCRSFLRGRGSVVRTCTGIEARVDRPTGDIANAVVVLQVEAYSGLKHLPLLEYALPKKSMPVTLDLVMFRHAGLWWVAPTAVRA